ncbi:alpha/beta hydrolase [Mycobacterium sp. CBMA293]|uniref:alpha/beta hydrolase n=1 Tax=unclassified Mycolicibacterium TaxID=2636767 RepID=UPI0012DEA2C0|nr:MULTISPECIES: alpha/beta hydrolase [unclassified Mycolicibacterium]MUL45782.1 alpha/beta hydrolase [Mycolicibacterium sp. CBMA 360]MUL60453.1 alpha/beta hydrolase [Mycolicibacterium sp. CBMA 335]MUL72268.1 alpha/beta hydrolase [Mycolicibacterium sp. CBMA 311]MUL95331.1 alpha/beta hydrolase [Mycolicibacterium sp. CBMA 230]MUM06849.1 esterase [Mycolicibacterium sp. CBMA 213]
MTAPSRVVRTHSIAISAAKGRRPRRYPVSDGAPVEIIEDGPSLAGRLMSVAATLAIKSTLTIGSYVPKAPWPWGMVDFVARVMRPEPGTIRATIGLPNCTAQLVRAKGVLPADGRRSVILYMHGGAFLTCGVHTHARVVGALSKYADAPVLVVDYRMIPKHSIGEAIEDCHDAYRWLRLKGYEPDQIVLAGDSAGGYLSLALAEKLQAEGELPAAVATMSPLFEIDNEGRAQHPNMKSDAMFPAHAFDALVELIEDAASRHIVDGQPEEVYEPLDHIEPGLPRTLIHVSGSEVLLNDARKAAHMLAACGVPVEVHVWPGQMHVFQLAAPLVKEADRSLKQIGDYIREATW